MSKFKTISITVIVTLLTVVFAVIAFVWSGLYPVAANSGHIAPVGWLLETTRKRSVAVRASDLVVPEDLESSERVAAGAGRYKEMCAGGGVMPAVPKCLRFTNFDRTPTGHLHEFALDQFAGFVLA